MGIQRYNGEKSDYAAVGLYVVSYEGEGVCKVGISGDMPTRLSALQSCCWAFAKVEAFFFPLAIHAEISSGLGNYNALKDSAMALEALCHKKLTELDVHIRGEFFEIDATDAVKAVQKIATQNGFRLATPEDILAFDMKTLIRVDDRVAYAEMVLGAERAREAMGC